MALEGIFFDVPVLYEDLQEAVRAKAIMTVTGPAAFD